MNTQLVKYLVVSTLQLSIFALIDLPVSGQTVHTNSSAAYDFRQDDYIGFFHPTCPDIDTASIWQFNTPELTPNRNIHWEVLPQNHMRYAIYERPGPPSIRLLVNAGLLMEESEAQEGICDLLMKYFAYTNKDVPFSVSGSTDFNGNVYAIDLPTADESLIEQALTTLAAHAHGCILKEEDLDSLKEDLLSAYEIPPPSIDDLRRSFLFSESQLARKNNLNDLKPNRETLKNFIDHWYSSDRFTLIITGDINPETIHTCVERHFSNFDKAPITYPTPRTLDPVHSDIDAHAVLKPEADFARILFETVVRKKDTQDSIKTRRQALLSEIEQILVEKRFSEVSEVTEEIEDTCIRFYDHLNTFDIRKIRITTSPEHWEKSIEIAVDQLVRIVYKGGFSEEEFKKACDLIEERYQKRVETLSASSNTDIADTIVGDLKKSRTPTSREDDFHFTKETLKDLSVNECNEDLYRIWQTQQCYLIAEGNIQIETLNEALDALTQSYLESAFSAVRKHKGVIEIPETFTTKPQPSPYSIFKTNTYEHLGLAQIRYENNFCLNIANNHSDTNLVYVTVRFGTGKLNEDLQKPGLGYLAEHIFLESGLAGFDSKTVQTLQQQLGIELAFEMQEDAFLLRGKAPPEHMLTLIQLLFAYISEPKLSPRAFDAAKEKYIQDYNKALQSAEGVLHTSGNYYIFSPKNIFKAPSPESIKDRTLEELKHWIAPTIQESVIEMSIVGAFESGDIQYISETLNNTFATLSPRKLEINTTPGAHTIEITPENQNLSFTHTGDNLSWGARIAWPTCDGWSKIETRKLRIANEILEERIHNALNAEFGKQYTNKVESINSLTYHNLGCIQSTVFNHYQHAEKTKDIILNEAQKLQDASKITFEEFRDAIKPMLDAFKTFSPKTTGIWDRDLIRAHVIEKMKAIANTAMDLVNTDQITYEELKKAMTSQVGNMKKAAHYKAALPETKDALEHQLESLKNSLIEKISSLNPNDLTQEETENITYPTIESIIKISEKIEKTMGSQAQTNLKDWFKDKTESVLQELRLLAQENGIDAKKPPEELMPTLSAFQLTPFVLPENKSPKFYEQFESEALKQAEHIDTLIKLINKRQMNVYGDVTNTLTPYRNEFAQMAHNLSFQKSTTKKQERSIERKIRVLVDNAWELAPELPSKDDVSKIITPLAEELVCIAAKRQEHEDLEDLLDQSIETTLRDAWDVLNPHHITEKELQKAVGKLKSYLQAKSNTLDYWMDNVLIGSQFYPQKLDWAPHLLSDYLEVEMKEISNTMAKYLSKERAYIIEALPKTTLP